jgi:probable F420-dependent oxidoreductase
MRPEFSVMLWTLSPEQPESWDPLFEQVRAVEAAGVDRIVLSGEHVVFGEHLDAYSRPEIGGRVNGRQPTGPDGHFLEPMVTMAVVAGITSRVRLSDHVMLAALRQPIVLAKAAATLDVLSGGRLDLAVGVGWQREEYEAAGLDFDRRGRLLDHTLSVCQTLWREPRASYSSPELTFEHIHMMPKPVQAGGVPIWVSGEVKPPAMRRLARFGTGWVPWGTPSLEGAVDELVDTIARMREAVEAYGRDPTTVQITSKLPVVRDSNGTPRVGATMDAIVPLVDAGVTDFHAVLPVPATRAAAEDYLADWVTAFRAATA